MTLVSVGFAGMSWYVPLLSGLPNAEPDPIFWPRWTMALLTGWVALACFAPALQPVTLRLVGLLVCGVSIAYLTVEILAFRELVDLLPGRRSRPSLWNSVCFFFMFGLPAGYTLICGDLPAWTRLPLSNGDEFAEEQH